MNIYKKFLVLFVLMVGTFLFTINFVDAAQLRLGADPIYTNEGMILYTSPPTQGGSNDILPIRSYKPTPIESQQGPWTDDAYGCGAYSYPNCYENLGTNIIVSSLSKIAFNGFGWFYNGGDIYSAFTAYLTSPSTTTIGRYEIEVPFTYGYGSTIYNGKIPLASEPPPSIIVEKRMTPDANQTYSIRCRIFYLGDVIRSTDRTVKVVVLPVGSTTIFQDWGPDNAPNYNIVDNPVPALLYTAFSGNFIVPTGQEFNTNKVMLL